jgi:hypothetical protein
MKLDSTEVEADFNRKTWRSIDSITDKESLTGKTSSQKRGSKRRTPYRKPKEQSKSTQNWCCQSFQTEGNTEEKI